MSSAPYPPPPNYGNNFIVLNNKSIVIAYILWFFLGNLGVHRFYLGSTFFGLCQLVLGLLGWALAAILIGYIFLVPLWIWLIFDLIWIPLRTGHMNNKAFEKIAGRLS